MNLINTNELASIIQKTYKNTWSIFYIYFKVCTKPTPHPSLPLMRGEGAKDKPAAFAGQGAKD